VSSLADRWNEWGYALAQLLQGQLERGSLVALATAFAAGVLTSFTPCVYPMIPVTVAYMGSSGLGRRGRVFGLCAVYAGGLATVYAVLGMAAALLGKTFGEFTRSPWTYGVVGILILALGFGMLDLFSIPLPSFVTGIQQRGSRRGGLVGALLMGIAAGFVAAPCTAPVLGVLLVVVAARQQVLWGGLLLLAFSLGLSLLLVAVGVSVGLLGRLPRPGPWMERLKIAFAVLIVAVGAGFLVQAVRMAIVRGSGA
jgi:thiol:disulfide interchange protein DsbD